MEMLRSCRPWLLERQPFSPTDSLLMHWRRRLYQGVYMLLRYLLPITRALGKLAVTEGALCVRSALGRKAAGLTNGPGMGGKVAAPASGAIY